MEKKLSHASIILEISRNDMRRFKLDFAKKKWTELSVGYVLLPGKIMSDWWIARRRLLR